MKIAYLIMGNFSESTGVTKKILSQVKYWERQGNDVKIFCVTNKESVEKNLLKKDIEIINVKSYYSFSINPFKLNDLKKWKPDIIYFRHFQFSLSAYLTFKKIPTIIEINTDDEIEFNMMRGKLLGYLNVKTRNAILKNAKGIITVTKELEKRFSKFSENIITIPNGFDFDKVHKRIKSKAFGDVKVLFLGSSNQNWHGIDKIIYLAKKLVDVKFYIIGEKLQEELPLNVINYGYLDEDEYKDIILNSHIGIGTLALYRKGLNEASPLKVREYLAYGLPVIIAYEDTDFLDKELPFILKIDNNESNIVENVENIEAFIRNNKDKVVSLDEVKFLSYGQKESDRIKFMESTLG